MPCPWNQELTGGMPCDEFEGADVPEQLVTCPCCDGSGIEVYGISIREPGCHFSHDSSDERECPECKGLGFYVDDVEPDDTNDDFTNAQWGEHGQYGVGA